MSGIVFGKGEEGEAQVQEGPEPPKEEDEEREPPVDEVEDDVEDKLLKAPLWLEKRPKKNKEEVVCWNCGIAGHIHTMCKKPWVQDFSRWRAPKEWRQVSGYAKGKGKGKGKGGKGRHFYNASAWGRSGASMRDQSTRGSGNGGSSPTSSSSKVFTMNFA